MADMTLPTLSIEVRASAARRLRHERGGGGSLWPTVEEALEAGPEPPEKACPLLLFLRRGVERRDKRPCPAAAMREGGRRHGAEVLRPDVCIHRHWGL